MFYTRSVSIALLALSLTVVFGADTIDEMPTVVVDPIVVTANRGQTPARQVGSSVTVISAEEIAQSGQVQVAELLRTVPGLDVVRSGGAGQVVSVFIRGANAAHTLVMVDGVEINDPISPTNAYDFAHLSVENIERIEVVRGPQSTVYGSDAMAGVIHIITKKGRDGHHLGFDASLGSFNTHREAISADGNDEKFNYSLSAANLETKGYSISDPDGDKDGYENRALSAKLGYQLNERWSLGLSSRYTDGRADIDNGPGPFGDDPNYWTDATETLVKLQTNWSQGLWQGEVSAALEDLDRESSNGFDEFHHDQRVNATYAGKRNRFNWHNTFKLAQSQILTAGVDHEDDRGESVYDSDSIFGPYTDIFSEERARTTGVYLQDHLALDDLALTVGGRFDDHDRFGSKSTWRVAASYRVLSETYLKASIGTGFKAPSLYQLYAPFGNPDLKAEESLGWDAGVQFGLPEAQFNLGLSLFSSAYENLIDYSSATFAYANLGEVDTSGVELNLNWMPISALAFTAGYTHTKVEDDDGGQLVRRPRSKADLSLAYLFQGKGSLRMELRHIGKRNDFDFVNYSGVVEMDAYTLVNLGASLSLGKHAAVNARMENLFDEDYFEVFGYATPGTSATLGLHLNY